MKILVEETDPVKRDAVVVLLERYLRIEFGAATAKSGNEIVVAMTDDAAAKIVQYLVD